MAVGLKVDTNIEAQGSVVKMLDTGGSALDGELEVPLDKVGRGAVGVGGLDDTNLDLVGETGPASKISNKRSGQGGDAVTVEKVEDLVLANVVEDDAISITVKRAAAGARSSLGRGRGRLGSLDVVGATL